MRAIIPRGNMRGDSVGASFTYTSFSYRCHFVRLQKISGVVLYLRSLSNDLITPLDSISILFNGN